MAKRSASEQEAVQIIGAQLPRLEECLRLAWAEWVRTRLYHQNNGHSVSPRARASVMYDLVAGHARRMFAGVPGVRVGTERGFLTLTFGNRLVVRFKKLNAKLEWSGIPTEQQQLFACQGEIEGLPPRATFLVAGYVLDRTGTQIARLVLTCRDAHGLLWSRDLAEAAGGTVLPMPRPVSKPPPATLRSKIKTKDSKEAN